MNWIICCILGTCWWNKSAIINLNHLLFANAGACSLNSALVSAVRKRDLFWFFNCQVKFVCRQADFLNRLPRQQKWRQLIFRKHCKSWGQDIRDCSLVDVGLTCCCVVLHTFCVPGHWMSAFWTNHHQSVDSSQEPNAALTSVIGVIVNLSFLQIEILPLIILKSDLRSLTVVAEAYTALYLFLYSYLLHH